MKITEAMVRELNIELKDLGCIFRYNIMSHNIDDNIRIERVPMSNSFVSNAIINCTPEFYKYLDNFFRQRGIGKLSYNNDGSICWSTSGWDNVGDITMVRCISERKRYPEQIIVGNVYYICESSRWVDPDGDAYVEVYRDADKKDYIGWLLEAHFEKIM